jgi:hypothetical protein
MAERAAGLQGGGVNRLTKSRNAVDVPRDIVARGVEYGGNMI